MALQLFRGHIRRRSYDLVHALITRTLRGKRNAEVAQRHMEVCPHQHILRFDIAMNQFVVMSILQGAGDFQHILSNAQ